MYFKDIETDKKALAEHVQKQKANAAERMKKIASYKKK
jgi:hypothetical protein